MTDRREKKGLRSQFKLWQILLPLLIGIAVIVWMFFDEFDVKTFQGVVFSWQSSLFIVIAFLLMLCRDLGLIIRFRLMTDNQISWRQAFDVNVLSEFTSAITPSAVGGSGLVVLFLNKEGINAGRSTTIMIANLFLDELFFVLAAPIIVLFVPIADIFNSTTGIAKTIEIVFLSIYSIITLWTFILYVALFKKPTIISSACKWIFKIPFLRRWQDHLDTFSRNMENASAELSQKSFKFWLYAFGVTAFSWTARFLVVNALIFAFIHYKNQIIIFARQLLLWIVMIASPTPGGSGLSELAFKEYYNDINLGSGPILVITLLWRMFSYYFYLVLGLIVIPRWLKRITKKVK